MPEDRELQKQKDRAEITNQLVRGGILINGGGAVALLAFIQAIADNPQNFDYFAPWAAVSVAVFVLGVTVASLANFLRRFVSLRDNDPDSFKKKLRRRVSLGFQIAPPLLFAAGCGVFVYAVFRHYGGPA